MPSSAHPGPSQPDRRVVAGAALALVASLLASALMFTAPDRARAETPSGATRATEGAAWAWPTDGDHVVVTDYVAPATRYGRGHRGLDLAADGAILSPAEGIVRFAGPVAGRPVLTIDHGGGVVSSYEPVVASVSVGEHVARGTRIGSVIDGHCPTRCVHIGVRVAGEYVSPWRYLGSIPRAVLYPTRSSHRDRRDAPTLSVAATDATPSEATPSIRTWDSSRTPSACTSRRSTNGGSGSNSTMTAPPECSS